jgi:hypothetical protein
MVYILYLDASGDAGKPKNSNTQHFILGGLTCNPELSLTCSKTFADLLTKYFPDSTKKPMKIHYKDLIHGSDPWSQINRKNFADDFFNLLLTYNFNVFAMVIDKKAHWDQYLHPFQPYNLTLEYMLERYQRFLKEKNDLGLVVSDREDNALMNNLCMLFEKFKRDGTKYSTLPNIIDTIFFAPSQTCPMLQAADFCSYAVLSKYERGKIDRYNQIKPKILPYSEYKFPK